jgi:hypothetical protein
MRIYLLVIGFHIRFEAGKTLQYSVLTILFRNYLQFI